MEIEVQLTKREIHIISTALALYGVEVSRFMLLLPQISKSELHDEVSKATSKFHILLRSVQD